MPSFKENYEKQKYEVHHNCYYRWKLYDTISLLHKTERV